MRYKIIIDYDSDNKKFMTKIIFTVSVCMVTDNVDLLQFTFEIIKTLYFTIIYKNIVYIFSNKKKNNKYTGKILFKM